MTDLEKFIELYKSFGIKLKPEQNGDSQMIILSESDKHKKIGGYFGFYSSVIFDLEGKFIKQNFYE